MKRLLSNHGWSRSVWSPGVKLKHTLGSRISSERKHAIGVALAHKKALETFGSELPLLVLEDDVAIESEVGSELAMQLEVPKNADAIYLGFSRYARPAIARYSSRLARIEGMYATHAILYLSERYIEHTIETIDKSIAAQLPFDIGLSFSQKFFSVYALNRALFFQCDEYAGKQKFERFTRGSLVTD